MIKVYKLYHNITIFFFISEAKQNFFFETKKT